MARGLSLEKSSEAVAFTAMPSATSGESMSILAFTCIRFWVSVPVLSVHITVAAPMVSQACILRTKLLVFSILRMELANESEMAIGSPSGTDTTTSVTAIMMVLSE